MITQFSEFLSALREHQFLQVALLAALLASLASGVIGSYVVVRRIVFISGGISHAVLGGIGAAVFFGLDPILGAMGAAVVAALLIGIANRRARQHEDTLIGAMWSIGMAIGVIFIMRRPGFGIDPMTFLFGDILIVPREYLAWMAGLDAGILLIVLLLYRRFLAVCFDEEYAKIQGVAVEAVYLLLLCLIAVTVVMLIRVVGLILVIALLSLPAAVARHFARSLGWMMMIACLLSFLFSAAGIYLSYGPDLPTGPTIILVAGAAYFLTMLGSFAYRKIRIHGR